MSTFWSVQVAGQTLDVQLPPGYEAEVVFINEWGIGFVDIDIDPEGGLAAAWFHSSRVPCLSAIASITPDGEVSKYAEPCIDLPHSLAFDSGGRLFFQEGAGFWDDVHTVPRGGTAADTLLFVANVVVTVRDMAFDAADNLYLADVYHQRIMKVTPGGAVSVFADGFAAPHTGEMLQLRFHPDGDLYVADQFQGKIHRVSPSGVRSEFVTGLGPISGLEFLPNGDLLVSNRQTGELYLVTPEGIVSVWGSVKCSSPCRGGNDGPRNIISDSEGSLFMLMAPTGPLEGNRLVRIARVALDAAVEIHPDRLNLMSRGGYITAHVELPEGYEGIAIDIGSVLLNDSVPAEIRPNWIGDHDADGVTDFMLKFNRSAVQALLEPGDAVAVTLRGKLEDGTSFEGTDYVRVK